MVALSPIESEFASTEDAETYEAWLLRKVQAALGDERPSVAHDEAMAKTRGLIESKRRASSRLDR